MIGRGSPFHVLFMFLCLCTSSGAVKQEERALDNPEKEEVHISSVFDAQRDAIPVVNPTTPSTTTPLVAFASPPPPTALMSTPTNQVTTPTTAGTGGTWCIAMPSASPTTLQVALDYACGYGGADCSALQPGASCYDPNTVQDHASYAFNDYYQKNPIPTSCVFGGVAQLAYSDPSHGNCHFATPTSTATTPPATVTPSPVVLTPPVIVSPPPPVIVSPPPPVYYTPTTTVPGSPTIYGVAEPTGSPSSALSLRTSSLIVLITTCLMGSMVIAKGF
ncbi:hypothetical protein MLD38_019266 [Melastoma candidum]|uniref:Uncharacterized protein n=1 Tax=Melastoma candidum TaxID=119954 RepID=A0ACB9QXS1_9MYRT|nr:hypothetical protein MLD38_019266 [Melastoma candidum]